MPKQEHNVSNKKITAKKKIDVAEFINLKDLK